MPAETVTVSLMVGVGVGVADCEKTLIVNKMTLKKTDKYLIFSLTLALRGVGFLAV